MDVIAGDPALHVLLGTGLSTGLKPAKPLFEERCHAVSLDGWASVKRSSNMIWPSILEDRMMPRQGKFNLRWRDPYCAWSSGFNAPRLDLLHVRRIKKGCDCGVVPGFRSAAMFPARMQQWSICAGQMADTKAQSRHCAPCRRSNHRIRLAYRISCCEESRDAAVKLAIPEPTQHETDSNISFVTTRKTHLSTAYFMKQVNIIGDTSKRSFQLHAAIAGGKPIFRRKEVVARKVSGVFFKVPSCLVVMEA